MQYLTLLTQLGASKIATATANNTTINLTQIAIGDGNGTVPMPNATQTALVNEVYRANLNDLKVDENNANWVVAVGYIPSTEGNFWVREVGIYDADGDLIAVGNYPETFKPMMADNVAKDIYIKMIFEISSADAVTLEVDPSIVMASREYVSQELLNYALKSNVYTKNEVNLLNRGYKNRILNGNFNIWQEGDTFVGGNKYTADMWYSAGGVNVNRISDSHTDNGLRAIGTNGFHPLVLQTIELKKVGSSKDEFSLGSTHTVSAEIRGSVPMNVQIGTGFSDGSTAGNYQAIEKSSKIPITTNYQKITFTFTIGASPNPTNEGLEVRFIGSAVNKYMDIKKIQFEESPIATPFEQRDIGLELSMCQRYFYKSTSGVNMIQYYRIDPAGSLRYAFQFPSTMRIVPSASIDVGNVVNVTKDMALFSGGIGGPVYATFIEADARL